MINKGGRRQWSRLPPVVFEWAALPLAGSQPSRNRVAVGLARKRDRKNAATDVVVVLVVLVKQLVAYLARGNKLERLAGWATLSFAPGRLF